MRKLTLKQKKFVKITAKTLNPTEGAKQAYNLKGKTGLKDKHKQITLATTIASENMTKPDIVKAIEQEIDDLFEKDELKPIQIHKRNMAQNKNIPASNQALDMYYKIKGKYAPVKSINLNINPQNIDNRIKELQNELKQLN